MRVRLATLEDVHEIVEVHTADENLSGGIYDRYIRGGPWMATETLAIHLNNLLLDDQLVAVAELDGKIVGEVEVLFSEEPSGEKFEESPTLTSLKSILITGAGELGERLWGSLRAWPEKGEPRC